MRKTNLMIEVSDELYESIVEPYKKKKGFGRLVVQLLEGYANNDAIYGYINGALDNLDEKANESLLEGLNAMSDSVNMFSFLQQEAQSVVDDGAREFSSIGQRSAGQFKKGFEESGGTEVNADAVSREEVKAIVNEGISSIKDMLSEVLAGAQVTSEKSSSAVEEEKIVPISKTMMKEVEKPVLEIEKSVVEIEKPVLEVKKNIEISEPVKTEEQKQAEAEDAGNLLASLAGSLGSY